MNQSSENGQRSDTISIDVLRDLVHDLRSPLVAASGFLTLLEKAGDGPAAQRYAGSLRESIESLREVLDRTHVLYCRAPRS